MNVLASWSLMAHVYFLMCFTAPIRKQTCIKLPSGLKYIRFLRICLRRCWIFVYLLHWTKINDPVSFWRHPKNLIQNLIHV